MLKHALSRIILFQVAAMCIIGVLIYLLLSAMPSKAQEQTRNYASLLKGLTDRNVTVYIRFVSPTSGENIGWYIPDKLKEDEQEVGQRVLREIGDDYICVDEIGQGLTNVYCVPFSNISYINYYP